MEKKSLQEWKKVVSQRKEKCISFWFKNQTKVFLVFFVMVLGIGIFLWFMYWYSLGKNSSMIEKFLKEKKEVQFEESLYTKIEEEKIFREKQSSLQIQETNIFESLPDQSEEE
jgi:hypothetical protein